MVETNKIHHGNCMDIMKKLPDNCIDVVVTDPPYALTSIVKRFAKDNAAPEKYGKDGRFQRVSTGFMGQKWDSDVPSVEIWKEVLRLLKPGAFAFVMCSPRQDSLARMIVRLADAGFNTGFTSLYWTFATGFPKAMSISKVVAKRNGRNPDNKDKVLDGSYAGFQPKPAIENILVCMKPLSENTYIDQALKNRKGITWLDDVRIPYIDEKDIGNPDRGKGYPMLDPKKGWNQNKIINDVTIGEKGRFPANLLVSDDVLCVDSKGQQGATTGREPSNHRPNRIYGDYQGHQKPSQPRNDSGSFSRFFDLDKWFVEKLKQLPEYIQKTFPFLIVPKASAAERERGCEELEEKRMGRHQSSLEGGKILTVSGNERNNYRRNTHPTVKPIKLMSYLITLGSRMDDIVLDPFAGSGTTGLAAKMLQRKYILIEIDEAYYEIAKARLDAEISLFD